ncbi:MAG: aromatic amino acid lyase [Kiloniellales bacterium]
MRLVLDRRADMDLSAFYQVAWKGRGIDLSGAALARMTAARANFMSLIENDEDIVIYGVTTGYGHRASQRLNHEERKQQARRPPLSAMTSFGEPLPARVVRGIVFARLANFIEGHAAITPAIAAAVAGLLDRPGLPEVPALGNGCPGEITALSHLFSGLGQQVELAEKDSLSLINGSPCASALVADAALAARRRLDLALEVFALSAEAIKAPLGHFDAALDPLWEDPQEAAALQRLRELMDNSGGGERRPYQAPVSWRILPRVLGQAGRAVTQAEEVAEISLRAVSDNPVFIPPDPDAPDSHHPYGRIMSTGGYHNAKAYPAMDALAAIWADLALIADRHIDKLMHARVSLLPDGLRLGEGYLGGLAFTSAGFVEQARQVASPSLLPAMESGGYGQNDVPTPVFLAWRKEAEAAQAFEAVLAILAAICSQAFAATDRDPPPALADLLDETRTLFPPIEDPRALSADAEALAERFRSRVFS